MSSGKPLYTAQLDLGGAGSEIRVNDAPVFADRSGFNAITELPLNRWIMNGRNRLSLLLTPRQGQNEIMPEARGTVVIYVREFDAARDSRREVARLVFPGRTTQRDGLTVAETDFSVQVPWQPFRWFTSEELTDTEQTHLELAREIERFHQLLAAKDLEGLVRSMAWRDREDAAATYHTVEQQAENSRHMYRSFVEGDSYELRPPRMDTARLKLYGERRLAALELSNGQSPVYFRMVGTGMVAYMSLVFCRDKGKWIIIR